MIKIKPSQLPTVTRIELRHNEEALIRYRRSRREPFLADPRTCPLALALRETVTRTLGEEPKDVAVYDFHREIVLWNRQSFRAEHSQSVLEFVRDQDDWSHGDGPLGLYSFNWLASRRAAYGYDQRFEVLGSAGMLQAGNPRRTEVTASTKRSVSTDIPEPLFFDRYRVAFAAEMRYFFDAVGSGKSARADIHDGVKALELAEAATLSWREQRVVELDV